MKRFAVLAFGVTCYLMFLAVSLYTVAFIGDFGLTRTLDSAPTVSWPVALAIDLGLVVLFGLQHSVMARPWFEERITKYIPKAAERSVYVLASNVALMLVLTQWQPLGGTLWHVESTAGRAVVYTLYALGWLTVVGSAQLIDSFDLFGLRQAWLYYQNQEYTPLKYVTPGPYRYVRHPLYVGWITVFWAAPTMTVSHLLFAVGLTTYILIAIRYEERDLVAAHEEYAEYRRRVPMLIPRFWNWGGRSTEAAPARPAAEPAAVRITN